jgi:hypothetical protein
MSFCLVSFGMILLSIVMNMLHGLLLLVQMATIFHRQTCVKWCSQLERDAIFVVLQPHLLAREGSL